MTTVDEAERHRLELANIADVAFHAPGRPKHGELTVQSLIAAPSSRRSWARPIPTWC